MNGPVVRHEVVALAPPTRAPLAARLAPWVGEVGSPTAHAREHLREALSGPGGGRDA
jgi:hypothetical protein